MTPSKCEAPFAAESAAPAFEGGAAELGRRAVQAAYYAFVLLIPLETIDSVRTRGQSTFTFSRMVGLVLFGLALVNRRACFRRIPAAFWMTAWYLSACALSQLWLPAALDRPFFENQATLIQMLALFLISMNLFADDRFRGSLLRFYGWWISLVAVGVLLGVFGGVFGGTGGRVSILGQDPNVAAGFFALGAICVAGDPELFSSKLFLLRAAAALAAVVVLLMAILETGSRGGLIVFVVGVLGLVVCGGRGTRAKRALMASAVIVALGFMVAREFQQRTDTASRLVDTWNNGDTAGRIRIYDEAWAMIEERPLLGFGAANNYAVLGARLSYADGGFFYRDTHNLLLAVLTEVGVVGAAPFLAALLYALWVSWRHGRRTDDALPFALMCAEITINSSLTGYHQKLFWIVFAAAVACGLRTAAAA